MISQLQKFCLEYILDTLDISTSLRYYMYSINHGLHSVEEKSAPVLQSRVHDYFIFKQEILELAPNDLLHLASKGFLKFCSIPSGLYFITEWVRNGLTDKHIAIGFDVLEHICSESEVQSTESSDDIRFDYQGAVEKVKCELEQQPFKSDAGTKLIQKYVGLCKTLEKTNTEGTSQNDSTTREDVVVTISPRKVKKEKSKEILKTEGFKNVLKNTMKESLIFACIVLEKDCGTILKL